MPPAVLSQSPSSLLTWVPYHFFSDPGPRNDQRPCGNLQAILSDSESTPNTSVFISSFCPINVVVHGHEDDPVFHMIHHDAGETESQGSYGEHQRPNGENIALNTRSKVTSSIPGSVHQPLRHHCVDRRHCAHNDLASAASRDQETDKIEL